jgi:hypothetical protein
VLSDSVEKDDATRWQQEASSELATGRTPLPTRKDCASFINRPTRIGRQHLNLLLNLT